MLKLASTAAAAAALLASGCAAAPGAEIDDALAAVFAKYERAAGADGLLTKADFAELRAAALEDHCRDDSCGWMTPASTGVRRLDADGDGAASLAEVAAALDLPPQPAADEPQQLALAYGYEPDSMWVTWMTRANCSEGAGVTLAASGAFAAANSSTYEERTPWSFRREWEGGVFYSALLEGLTPGASYEYSVGADGCASSPARSFAARAAPSADRKTVIATQGDQGTFLPLGFDVLRDMHSTLAAGIADGSMHADSVAALVSGDISYAGIDTEVKILGVDSMTEDQYVWDLYRKLTAPLANIGVPLLTTVGNHDRLGEPNRGAAYLHRFRNPVDMAAGNAYWWSADVGSVHLVSMSTEHDYSEGSAQRAWLEADLRGVDRAQTPWVLLSGHRPFLSSDDSEYDAHNPEAALYEELSGLLIDTGVDLLLTGHMHCLEYAHPIAANGTVVPPQQPGNAYVDPPAFVSTMQGTGGIFQFEKWVDPQPDWSAYRSQGAYGWAQVTAHNATHLSYEFKRVIAEDPREEVPGFWIVKSS